MTVLCKSDIHLYNYIFPCQQISHLINFRILCILLEQRINLTNGGNRASHISRFFLTYKTGLSQIHTKKRNFIFFLDLKTLLSCYITKTFQRTHRTGPTEDKLLVYRCKRGNQEALTRIYEKYKVHLLLLAMSLLNDRTASEDVVHDVSMDFFYKFMTSDSCHIWRPSCRECRS